MIMKKILLVVLMMFTFFVGYSQKKYMVFLPEIKSPDMLVEEVYKTQNKYYMKTKLGEIQPVYIGKKRLHDTLFLKVKNFSHMVNLKYHSRNLLDLEVLFYFDKKTNSILLKQISTAKITNEKFSYWHTTKLMIE